MTMQNFEFDQFDDETESNSSLVPQPEHGYEEGEKSARVPVTSVVRRRHRRARETKRPHNTFAKLVLGSLAIMGILFVGTVGLTIAGLIGGYFYFLSILPPAEELAKVPVHQSSKILDRHGNLLYEIFDEHSGRRTLVGPEKIPEVLKLATIATEDPSFYTNPGVDVEGVARAVYYLYREGKPTIGGSTITQQLVKNTLLTPEVSFERKIREALWALAVTRAYSKEDILALYLNTNNFGNLSYGVQAAAESYFKKDVSQLDLAEATLLAGLPQAPAVYDPCTNPQAALNRQSVVLNSMIREGYITNEQADAAGEETVNELGSSAFRDNCGKGIPQVYPHFVEYVREKLEEQYGADMVYNGGLQVYTTIEPSIQKIVEEEARKQIELIKNKNVHSAAVVVMNSQTGEIYAMLGSVNFNDKSIDGQVNVANRLRQPGSSIKPFNYVTALEKGWTLATPILDARIDFPDVQKPYSPINYDEKLHGTVSVRTALANSYNIPAVKTLYYVTVPSMIKTAEQFGITTFGDTSRYGLALTLGGGEVKLVELTGAYSVFANQGQKVPVTPYYKILDGAGNVIYDIEKYKPQAQQVIDPRYAYLITSVLSDNKARTPAFGQNSPLKLCLDGTSTCKEDQLRPVAAKTGTTNDFRDNWTMGYTPDITVGVWVGNPRNEEMEHSTGITGAAPIWHSVMARIYSEIEPYRSLPPREFPIPSGLVRAPVCKGTGTLATGGCPEGARYEEIFLAEQTAPRSYPTAYQVDLDPYSGWLVNPQCPPDRIVHKTFRYPPGDIRMLSGKYESWGPKKNWGGVTPPVVVTQCPTEDTARSPSGGG